MTETTTSIAPEPTLIDQSALDSIRALQQPGAPDLLTRIITTYIDSADSIVAAMRESLATGDLELLSRSAHTLKSSSASLGAMRVSRLCTTLEANTRRGNLDGAEKLVESITREHERSAAALREEQAA